MDPLRPFAAVIRSLWQARASASSPTPEARKTGTTPNPATLVHAQSARTEESLRARLKSRISQVDPDDPRRVREAFVETVLLWELGEKLAHDAGFGEMVMQISDQLASDAAVDQRLQKLVLQIGR
jgi:hypothetical protein